MGSHKIGKLNFSFSREGLSYRWGDGEEKHIRFGKGGDDFDDIEEDYGSEGEPYDGYSDRDDGYGEDDYGDPYASDQGYGDDAYSDQDYGEDAQESDDYGYDYEDSDYSDDGYGADYGDDGYYDEGDYPEGDDYAEDLEDGVEYEEPSTLLRYVEENDWVTYALLVLLPPLGIYLLWRRQKFDMMLRAGISAVSALWFIGIIVLLILLLPKGGPTDVGVNASPSIIPYSPSPTPTVSATVAPSVSPTTLPADPDSTNSIVDNSIVGATSTPLPSDTQSGDGTTSDYVYSQATGIYYHSSDTCANLTQGVAVSRISVDAATARGQVQCPICYDEKTFWMTDNGTWYHANSTCSRMQNARSVTRAEAENAGKIACPVCVTGESTTLPDSSSSSSASTILNAITKLAKQISTDQSGINVWCTSGGTYFHTKSNCTGMSGANQVTLLRAMQMGKAPCPTCASAAGTGVWCTTNVAHFHANSSCSGMKNAVQVPLYLALVYGKTACPTCLSQYSSSSSGSSGTSGTGTTTDQANSGEVYVWATANGQYYHAQEHCSGMTGASRVTLKAALEAGRPACPTCASAANTTVYATSGGQYYHSYATCSGMSGASSGTLAQALALGYKRCPECWMSSGESSGGSSGSSSSGSSSGSSVSGVSVYCTQNGTYYHTLATCSGMSGASKVSLEAAIQAGKVACPTCASLANRTVYAVKNGKYYHYTTNCSVENLSDAISGSLAYALANGFAPCPTCTKSSSSGSGSTSAGESSGEFTPGTSGAKVYATASGPYYHTSKSCAGSGAAYVTLETALNYGKTACPKCASVGGVTVYATKNSKYFHLTKQHAGSGAVSGQLGTALGYGLTICPECYAVATGNTTGTTVPDTDVPTSSNTFKSGTSGYKVYASVDAADFHLSRECPACPSNVAYVTLETALNYGKSACVRCASLAYTPVYGSTSNPYYHLSKSCSYCPSNATRIYLGYAVALGLKSCPVCVDGAGTGDVGTGDDGTGGGTDVGIITPNTIVYIDLQGDSNAFVFHSSSKCSRGGMSSGSGVTLEFALEQGFTACPYCF